VTGGEFTKRRKKNCCARSTAEAGSKVAGRIPESCQETQATKVANHSTPIPGEIGRIVAFSPFSQSFAEVEV